MSAHIRRFRKKPVTIEAVQFLHLTNTGFVVDQQDMKDVPWLAEAVERRTIWPEGPCIMIGTLEGDHCCRPGDWIIRGVKGELYPCKPDIFELTYEAAPDDGDTEDGDTIPQPQEQNPDVND